MGEVVLVLHLTTLAAPLLDPGMHGSFDVYMYTNDRMGYADFKEHRRLDAKLVAADL